ncbi:MAG: tyrosine-type recombinase/integrase [Solirubrobacteraceae bacterium]
MAHVSCWLAEQLMGPDALSPEVVVRFRNARRAVSRRLTGRRALEPLLGYLSGLGLLSESLVELPTLLERLLAEYCDYLVRERGLVAGSVDLRERVARLFLAALPEPLELALGQLQAGDVTAFVLAQCGSGRRGSVWSKTLTGGLRSLLGYLHLTGWVPVGFSQAVPSVAGWRLASLPRALEAEQVARLLESCDRSTVVGSRDFAILMLLSRLGLGSCEVAALRLDGACDRAGMARVGAHRLRHTLASELLRTGAGLEQIAQVLRHSSVATTAVYAKVDRASLRSLARPWPLAGGLS